VRRAELSQPAGWPSAAWSRAASLAPRRLLGLSPDLKLTNHYKACLLRALQVDDAELHFLILHFLASGPCRAAASTLERDATTHSLLPTRIDYEGDTPGMIVPTFMHALLRRI
jgi:hypothetical protein